MLFTACPPGPNMPGARPQKGDACQFIGPPAPPPPPPSLIHHSALVDLSEAVAPPLVRSGELRSEEALRGPPAAGPGSHRSARSRLGFDSRDGSLDRRGARGARHATGTLERASLSQNTSECLGKYAKRTSCNQQSIKLSSRRWTEHFCDL